MIRSGVSLPPHPARRSRRGVLPVNLDEGRPAGAFFDVTKKLHNGLQGKPTSLSAREIERYWRHNELTAQQILELSGQPDVLVLHDAQVLPVAMFLPPTTQMVWHCHVDLTTPDETARDLGEPLA